MGCVLFVFLWVTLWRSTAQLFSWEDSLRECSWGTALNGYRSTPLLRWHFFSLGCFRQWLNVGELTRTADFSHRQSWHGVSTLACFRNSQDCIAVWSFSFPTSFFTDVARVVLALRCCTCIYCSQILHAYCQLKVSLPLCSLTPYPSLASSPINISSI